MRSRDEYIRDHAAGAVAQMRPLEYITLDEFARLAGLGEYEARMGLTMLGEQVEAHLVRQDNLVIVRRLS